METKLLDAIKNQQIEIVWALLEREPSLAQATTSNGVSYLQLACYHGNHDIIQSILGKRDRLNLFEAAACGNLKEVIRNLAQFPEKLHDFSPDGFPALGLACFFGKKDVVRYLLEMGAQVNQVANNAMKVTPLHAAVSKKNIELVAMLLEYGANVNAKQQQGLTPLHAAMYHAHSALVEMLLNFGADPEARMDNGTRPIEMAPADFLVTASLLLSVRG